MSNTWAKPLLPGMGTTDAAGDITSYLCSRHTGVSTRPAQFTKTQGNGMDASHLDDSEEVGDSKRTRRCRRHQSA
jgi:hypothetical protein